MNKCLDVDCIMYDVKHGRTHSPNVTTNYYNIVHVKPEVVVVLIQFCHVLLVLNRL
jgi:hypothetical protein